MKKNYFSTLFAALMLFVAMPASAQVATMKDLCGKYTFSATIVPTDAGQAHTNVWKNDCEVTIGWNENHSCGEVKGLMGSTQNQLVSGIDVNNKMFYVNNPNPNYGLLSTNAGYFGVTDMTLENVQMYTMEYYYNSDTKEITIPDFSIAEFTFPGGNMTATELAKVTNAKLTPIADDENDKPESTPFVWESTFTITADVQSYNDAYTYPTTFEMTVKNWGNDIYTITNFMGYDISGLNGGAGFNVKSDTEAEIKAGAYIGVPESGKVYFTIADMNNQPNNVKVTVNEDGTLSIDNFCVNALAYSDDYSSSTTSLAAFYTNVKSVVEGEEEEEEPTPFVWESTFTITADVQSYNDAYTYPTTFEMTVKNWGNDIYTITNFMGYDISGLNGGAGFNVKSDTEAEIKAGAYIGVPESGKVYFTIADMNNQPNNVKVTVNEDGTLSIDDFCVNALVYSDDYSSSTRSLAAFYTNVKSVVEGDNNTGEDVNAVESIVVETKVQGIFDLTGRKFEAITTPGLYIVNGKKVVVK